MPGIDYHQGRARSKQHRRDQKPDPILPHEVCPGCIVWLGLKKDIGPENIVCIREDHCNGQRMEGSRYCHPVLVLEIRQRPGSKIEGDLVCLVTDLTSFGHTPLEGYIKHQDLIKFNMSIPIYHGESSLFDHVPQLRLVSCQMPEKTYVRFQHIWQIQISSLANLFFSTPNSKPYDLRIDLPSYNILMALFERPPQEYLPIDQVLATGDERLRKLVENENMDNVARQLQDTIIRGIERGGLEALYDEQQGGATPGRTQRQRPPYRENQLNPEAAIFTPRQSTNS